MFINVFSYQIRDCSIGITILNIGFPRELNKILFAYSLTFEHRTLRPCNQTKLHTKRTIFSGVVQFFSRRRILFRSPYLCIIQSFGL